MQAYAEIGVGNPSFISTEIEFPDGKEIRVERWIVGSNTCPYVRIWIWKRVIGFDFQDGLSVRRKSNIRIKILFGIASTLKGGERNGSY